MELQQRVMAYNQLLKYHGIKDHQVSKTSNENNGRLLWLLIKRIFILTILGLWAFPGGILNLPVVIVAKVISQKKAQGEGIGRKFFFGGGTNANIHVFCSCFEKFDG